MINILKTEPKIAVGTNMVTSAIMGTFGFIGHVVSNEVNLLYLIILGPSAMIGGFLELDIQIVLFQQLLKN